MKKKLAGILIFAMTAMVLGGCGGRQDAEKYVTLGDYSNIEVVMDTVGVDAEELSFQMNDVYANFVTKERGGILDRAVKVGDTVNIDYVGKKNDVPFDGGTAQGQALEIGSGQYIPGFEEGLVGAKPGETVDLNISFPDNYGVEELNGQPVVFTVTVNYIYPSGLTADEMDDTVVASIGIPGVSNGKELEQYVNDWLYSQFEENLEANIVNEMITRCTFAELPKKLLEPYQKEWEDTLAMSESYFTMQGISVDMYLSWYGYDNKEAFINENAEKDLKKALIMEAVANRENITVSDDELQSWLQEEAEKVGYTSVEDYLGGKSKEDFRQDCLNEKVLHFLMDKTTIIKKAE